ncbi:UNG1 [Candida jiufengensis]|uniref:UNG1 n=1 Tax=Candida jiufengensis TaxID=497108 RepID=UPI002225B4A6|nr:UNG1 [Candida jiufengensis]KAI5952610.1 UNG1 [Candida jiufengensis]
MTKRPPITSYFGTSSENNAKKQKIRTKEDSEGDTDLLIEKSDQDNKLRILKDNKPVEITLEELKFCKNLNFDKENWINTLTVEQKLLLNLEINTLNITWLALIHKELTKPYFQKLKQFLNVESSKKTIFPKQEDIYSWSNLTPVNKVKCLILGQDPYHNHNQAHGLAFSVLEPNRPPPSLINIYKTLKIDYPDYKVPNFKALSEQGKPGGGNLTNWSKQGVLLLNTILTVESHKANSHKKKGWEIFTEKCIELLIKYYIEQNQGFVIMAWGSPAQKSIEPFKKLLDQNQNKFLILRTVHPSPLSARRGFFESNVFKKCNQWLVENGKTEIDWNVL